MTPPLASILLLPTILIVSASAQSESAFPPPAPTSFRPSIAVVIGVFAIMFSLTFLLLMYARFCHSAATHELFNRNPNLGSGSLFVGPGHRNTRQNVRTSSGIDKTVIESLPFFRFSSLKGSRDGLECAVCLSKFDDAEVLRLLPKCKHAFHVDCVDRWLESHSTCPLCRYRIDPDDANLFKCSNSTRFLFTDHSSSRRDDENANGEIADLFVEREPDDKKDLLVQNGNPSEPLHNFKHRIIVSDVVFKSRWSDLNSSDFMLLSSDMLSVTSSKRFDDGELKIKKEMEGKRLSENKASEITIPSLDSAEYAPTRQLISPGNRCMSEIANVPRFHGVKSVDSDSSAADEKVRRLWLPIARRTVQWFAGRERRAEELRHGDNRGDSYV